MEATKYSKKCKCGEKPKNLSRGVIRDADGKIQWKVKYCPNCMDVTHKEQVEIVKKPKEMLEHEAKPKKQPTKKEDKKSIVEEKMSKEADTQLGLF